MKTVVCLFETQMKTKKTKGDLYIVAAEELGVDEGLTEGFS